MEITTKQLRIKPGRIVSQAASGMEITITYRGKPRAKIIPLVSRKDLDREVPPEGYPGAGGERQPLPDELFGLWKTRKDTKNVEQFARNLRKGRKL